MSGERWECLGELRGEASHAKRRRTRVEPNDLHPNEGKFPRGKLD